MRVEFLGCRSAESLILLQAKRTDTREAEVRDVRYTSKHVRDSWNAKVVAIRQVNPLQASRVPLATIDESVNCLIRQVDDFYEPYATQLAEVLRDLKHGHVCELRATCQVDVS